MNANYPLTKRRIKIILALLKNADLDQNQIAEMVHMTRGTANRYVKLMVAEGLAHVPRWVQPNGLFRHIRVLRAGPGTSVPRPAPISTQARCERWRKKVTADPERYDSIRSRHNAQRRKITPDPLHAWIPVRATNTHSKDAA